MDLEQSRQQAKVAVRAECPKQATKVRKHGPRTEQATKPAARARGDKGSQGRLENLDLRQQPAGSQG